jgi:hypothetical protein
VILHAKGDESAARRLAEGLGSLQPVVCSFEEAFPLPQSAEKAPLIFFWSTRAASARMAESFAEAAARHVGAVFVSAAYGEDVPAALAAYRMIEPNIGLADFNTALRAQQIFLRERNARAASHVSQEKRRARAKSNRAFAGGAMMGFASSVALVGALGAGAISAAGQLKLDTDGLAPPPGVPLLKPLEASAEAPSWSVAQLENVSYSQQVAQVEQALAEAQARMDAAPSSRVVLDMPSMPASDDGMWRPTAAPVAMASAAPAGRVSGTLMAASSPAAASGALVAPASPLAATPTLFQVASLQDAKLDADQMLEIPDLAPDFWRIVNGADGVEMAKVPDPTLISDYSADDGLWRPT